MAETPLHMEDMIDTIQVLQDHFSDEPNVYVWGNMLLYYEEGNPRKHVSPDVLMARGVPRNPDRDYYLVWKEGKAPDFIVEITSKSTKQEDKKKKFVIYRDVLKVTEYFLFDPRARLPRPAAPGLPAGRGGIRRHRTGRRPAPQSGPGPCTWSETDNSFACSIRLPACACRRRGRAEKPPPAAPRRSAAAPRRSAAARGGAPPR